MEYILNVLIELKRTRSKLEKISILKKHLNDQLFQTVVIYALDETLQYGVNALPKQQYDTVDTKGHTGLFNYLAELAAKPGTTYQEKLKLRSYANNAADLEIIKRIINKNLKCGVRPKLVNAAMPGLLPITPYQRCSTMNKMHNINFPAYSQRKADTQFGYFFVTENKPKVMTRNGKIFTFATDFFIKNAFISIGHDLDNYVLCGELQVYDIQGNVCDRQTGNGVLSKALKGTISEAESDRIFYEVWDAIPIINFYEGYYAIPYKDRLQLIQNTISDSPTISTIKTVIVNSSEEAQAEAANWIAFGFEGNITKDFSVKWKNNTSTLMIKGKAEKECEMEIIECLYGDKGDKYENCIGRFVCHSSDGKIISTPGSGISDKQRGIIGWDDENDPILFPMMEDHMDSFIGGIVSIIFNTITSDKKTKQKKLYLPRISEFRNDKTEADTAEYIKEL